MGRDLVNHCVNDILVQGASPLFFLDYVAMGKLEPDVVEALVKGLSIACAEHSCALLGAPFCAQGVSVDAGGGAQLTNAIDAVMGNL